MKRHGRKGIFGCCATVETLIRPPCPNMVKSHKKARPASEKWVDWGYLRGVWLTLELDFPAKAARIDTHVGAREKMIIIGEIADKMASIPKLWAITAVLALPFLLGAIHRKIAWLLLPLAICLSGWIEYDAYHETFVEAGMKESIHQEMGCFWILNALASSILPAIVAITILIWQLRKTNSPNQAMHRLRRKVCDHSEVQAAGDR